MNNNLKKKKIRVFVITGSSRDVVTTNRIKNSEGKFIYSGFIWDIWSKISNTLNKKYDFEIFFSKPEDNDYDNFVKEVYQGKYDLVIGTFSYSKKREKMVNYTTPFMINANAILCQQDSSVFNDLIYILKSKAGKVFLYALIIGIVIGILLFFFDHQRYKHVKKSLDIKKDQFLIRSIVTGISSMVGQTGYLSEHVTLEIKQVLLVIIILIISFVFIMFLQASITSILIKKNDSFYNRYNVRNYTFLGFSGSDNVRKITRFGANVDTFDNLTVTQLIEKYLANKDKYGGVILSAGESYGYLQEDLSLKISLGFGFEPQAFVVNHKQSELLEDINLVLNDLRYTLTMNKLCKSYFPNMDNVTVPVCKL